MSSFTPYGKNSITTEVAETYDASQSGSNTQAQSSLIYGMGQSFVSTDSARVQFVGFWIVPGSGGTGNLYAEIYETVGTPGTNALPTGSPIAISRAVAESSLPVLGQAYNAPVTLFTFDDIVNLEAGGEYALVLNVTESNDPSGVLVAVDTSAPTDPGNDVRFVLSAGVWSTNGSFDVSYVVYNTLSFDSTFEATSKTLGEIIREQGDSVLLENGDLLLQEF